LEVLDLNAKIENSNGAITISTDVLATLAGDAAMHCYGVVGMATRSKTDGWIALIRKDNFSKGIKIIVDEGGLTVQLHVIVEYGVNIKITAGSIMENVKYQLEKFTGFIVKQVDVNVESVRVD
jgi:uncharacterized alkaline shock family protein YloU